MVRAECARVSPVLDLSAWHKQARNVCSSDCRRTDASNMFQLGEKKYAQLGPSRFWKFFRSYTHQFFFPKVYWPSLIHWWSQFWSTLSSFGDFQGYSENSICTFFNCIICHFRGELMPPPYLPGQKSTCKQSQCIASGQKKSWKLKKSPMVYRPP